MYDFIVANYMIFIVIAVVLLLGLFGYIMDKKKYIDYRNEILNEGKVNSVLENVAEVSNVATAVKVNDVELNNSTNGSNQEIPSVTDSTN